MYKPTRLAGREPRRRRSESREAAEPCPTVGPRSSSPATVVSLAWHPQPFPRPGRPHLPGHGACSTYGQTRRQVHPHEIHHRDAQAAAWHARGAADPSGHQRRPGVSDRYDVTDMDQGGEAGAEGPPTPRTSAVLPSMETQQAFGALGVLVNNAAAFKFEPSRRSRRTSSPRNSTPTSSGRS